VTRRCQLAHRVLPYVDGELNALDAVVFEDHLEECASCGRAVAAQRHLEERLVALPRPLVDTTVRARLHAAIDARIDSRIDSRIGATAIAPRAPHAPILRWRRPLLAAAGVALIAALALLPRLASNGTTVANLPPSADGGPRVAVAPASDAANDPIAAPFALDRPAPNLTLFAIARNEIARCVADLPADGDPVAAFADSTRAFRAGGVPVVQLLEEVLKDPDPALGCVAACLFALAARTDRLGPEDPFLVPTLEGVMRRPDRGDAMLRTLVTIGTPRAWLAVAYACEMPHLRRDALVAIAGRADTVALPKLAHELTTSLRRGERDDVAAALGALAATTELHARLLAELARAGADEGVIAAALARVRPDATAALVAMLAQRGEPRRDALLLAPLLRGAELVAPLAELAARGEESAVATDALARLGGPAAIAAFARLAGDPSLSRSRGRTVANAFAALLARCDDLPGALGAAARELKNDERSRGALLDLCLAVQDEAGGRARLVLLACADLPPADRTRLATERMVRRERTAPDDLLAILTDAAARRAEGKADDRLLAALLLLVYANGGDERLMEGVHRLGVSLTASREARLRTTAKALVRSPAAPRELERLHELLQLAP